jgi:hypothetical protein
VALVFLECGKIGLNGVSSLQKNNAYSIARDPADEAPGIFNHAAHAAVRVRHVNGPLGRQHAKLFRRKPAVAPNIGEHLFRRLAGKTAYGGANRGPKRKDGFMDGHQVNDIAGIAPVGGG